MGLFDRAENLYVGSIFALVAIVLWGGCCDGYLFFNGDPTISQFLRAHPRYYFGPLVGVLAFVALLTIHLYLTGY